MIQNIFFRSDINCCFLSSPEQDISLLSQSFDIFMPILASTPSAFTFLQGVQPSFFSSTQSHLFFEQCPTTWPVIISALICMAVGVGDWKVVHISIYYAPLSILVLLGLGFSE